MLFVWVLYKLFIRGHLLTLIMVIFGWFGMSGCLMSMIPESAHRGIIVSDTMIPWCTIIPSLVIILLLATKKE